MMQMTEQNQDSITSLHLAARRGDLEEVKRLIAAGYAVNATDQFGSSALHVAVLYDHAAIVNYLLEHKAKINLPTYIGMDNLGLTAVDLAIHYAADTLALQCLLANGGAPAHWDRAIDQLMDNLFETILLNDFENFHLILSKLDTLALGNANALAWDSQDERTPVAVVLQELASFTRNEFFLERLLQSVHVFIEQDESNFIGHFLLAKNLLSVFPSDKEYYLMLDDSLSPIFAEGHYSSFTTKTIIHLLQQYQENLTSSDSNANLIFKESAFNDLYAAFVLGNNAWDRGGLEETSELLLAQYEAGVTLLLPTGWWGHAIDIIIDKESNLFMVANAGDSFPSLPLGLNAYNMHFDLTVDDIYHILNNNDQMDLEFKYFYDLGLTFNEAYSFTTSPQIYGNCAWNSQLISEQAILYLSLSKTTHDSELAFSLANEWFNELNEFQKTEILKTYLVNPTLNVHALGDILTHYHPHLDSDSQRERASLILDCLTSNELRASFHQYYSHHRREFSDDLNDFMIENGYLKNNQTRPFISRGSQNLSDETIYIAEVINEFNEVPVLQESVETDAFAIHSVEDPRYDPYILPWTEIAFPDPHLGEIF